MELDRENGIRLQERIMEWRSCPHFPENNIFAAVGISYYRTNRSGLGRMALG